MERDFDAAPGLYAGGVIVIVDQIKHMWLGVQLRRTASKRSAGGVLRRLVVRSVVVTLAFAGLIAGPIPGLIQSASATTYPTTLLVGQSLSQGGELVSYTGSKPSTYYYAILQNDGNFVVYYHQSTGNTAKWATGTNNGYKLTLQRDGNLVLTNSSNSPVWAAGTEGEASYSLLMQTDGNLGLWTSFNNAVWSWVTGLISQPTAGAYVPGELYGGSNSGELCYTCSAAQISGAAPPQLTLDSKTGVNNVTGDFSTTNSLFSAPAIGGSLGLSVTYDAALVQAQISSGLVTYPGMLGWGWTSNDNVYASSSTAGSATTVSVSSENGAQVNFTDVGTSTSCPTGDDSSSLDYTVNDIANTSADNWCAPARVQAQLADYPPYGFAYETHDQGSTDITFFYWNGTLDGFGSLASAQSNTFISRVYNVAPGSTPSSSYSNSSTQACPSGLGAEQGCTVSIASDGRDTLDVGNTYGQMIEAIDPSGAVYSFGFDSYNDLTSIKMPNGSYWFYDYGIGNPSPNNHDLEAIYDPDTGGSSPPGISAGAAHSTTIWYNTSGPSQNMVSQIEDGPGSSGTAGITKYSYTMSAAAALGGTLSSLQSTTVKYPATTPKSGSPVTPEAIDMYTDGVLTNAQMGDTTASNSDAEIWNYNWTLSDGSASSTSTETITYPHALVTSPVPTATILLDSRGNAVQVTDALGYISTSHYRDGAGQNLPELKWSFAGAATWSSGSVPAGAAQYKYDSQGNMFAAYDPIGNQTRYGYYPSSGLICWKAPPSDSNSSGTCAGNGTAGPSGAAPIGATSYTYDAKGDLTATTTDQGDSGSNADPQTTLAQYNTMGQLTDMIPPQGVLAEPSKSFSTNDYATHVHYYADHLPSQETKPLTGTILLNYDAVGNLVQAQDPGGVYVQIAYDGDNRPCYTLTTGSPVSGGPVCGAANAPGSSATVYEPGTTAPYQKIDANGNPTMYFYGDTAYPTKATETDRPAMGSTTPNTYTAYDDVGAMCVSGSVPTNSLGTRCTGVAGDTNELNNALGEPLSVEPPSPTAPDAATTTTYEYKDPNFDTVVSKSTSPIGVTMNSYNLDGQLTQVTQPDNSVITTGYNADAKACYRAPFATTAGCATPPTGQGVSTLSYNNADELASMVDNNGTAGATTSTWSYAAGMMTSTTDANSKIVSYLYGFGGQVICTAYPIAVSGGGCGSVSSSGQATGTPSNTNTIELRSYDSSGRLSAVQSWADGTSSVQYSYADKWLPTSVTSISYPGGASANYVYDNVGNVTQLTQGSNVTDSWGYNFDNLLTTSTLNGTSYPAPTYNEKAQVTQAEDPTANSGAGNVGSYSLNSDGSISSLSPNSSGGTTTSAYQPNGQMCWTTTSSSPPSSCSSNPTSGTAYTYTGNGQRQTATPIGGSATNYNWSTYGQLCSFGPTPVTGACGTPATGDTLYSYNGQGLRMSTTDTASTVDLTTWDSVSGASTPLNINDAVTPSGSSTTNTSYVYGDLMFGGTAPVEQISTSGSTTSVLYLVPSPSGVRAVINSAGSLQELALYSPYGTQYVASGSNVTPFGFQGSYTDSGVLMPSGSSAGTGLIYLINRYYDPSIDQFISVDPLVSNTGQPYVFTGADPLNSTDPLGLFCWGWCTFTNAWHAATHFVSAVVHLCTTVLSDVWGAVTVAAGWTADAVSTAVDAVSSAVTAATDWAVHQFLQAVSDAIAVTRYLEALQTQIAVHAYLTAVSQAHAAWNGIAAAGRFTWHHIGTIATIGAVGLCIAYSLGVCAIATAAALAGRFTQRAQSGEGLGWSDAIDAGTTVASFGLLGVTSSLGEGAVSGIGKWALRVHSSLPDLFGLGIQFGTGSSGT